ncbi:hypothetical protein [Micromonospora musae]|uniref:hypothetical protein n=1 Tax=Micromonospora musae TaxID=1894970 RepID=UPI0011C44098|nr:hypothetical protein [Micromonospora musae]
MGMANGAKLANVKDEIRAVVGSDTTATEVASALDGLFEITSYKRFRAFNAGYIRLYAMPTKTLRGSLVIDREVMVLIAPFSSLQARTVCQRRPAR